MASAVWLGVSLHPSGQSRRQSTTFSLFDSRTGVLAGEDRAWTSGHRGLPERVGWHDAPVRVANKDGMERVDHRVFNTEGTKNQRATEKRNVALRATRPIVPNAANK